MDALEQSDRRWRQPLPAASLSVGVTVDLELAAGAGGHVKCWQRIAEAAAAADGCDLTVYFLGPESKTIALGDQVRYRIVPPRRGTRGLGLRNTPGHTDLARRNPAIGPMLLRHDVLHTTGPFALSGSAAHVSARALKPLVSSVHTDNPALTRHYMPEVMSALCGGFPACGAAARWLGLPELGERHMAARVARGLAAAWHLLHSNMAQRDAFRRTFPETQRSRMRRGIDRHRFNPGLRDRVRLRARFDIPALRPVLAFAGRIDTSKNAGLVADTAAVLWSSGLDFTLLMLGEGALRETLVRRCGPRAVLPGLVPQQDLAWMLASADAFIFPSETETVGNAALEAKASGLPLFVMAGTAPGEAVQRDGEDGVMIAGRDPAQWARAIAPVLADAAQLNRHRRAARHSAAQLPSWQEVLEQDLIPIWCRLAGRVPLGSTAWERQSAEAAD